jgi:hypothetical protein
MIQLTHSLRAWRTPDFEAVLKDEIAHLDAALLPLQQGLTQSSHANADALSVRIISAVEQAGCIQVKVGLFYTGVIAGCSCADDPTPVDVINEYCEARFDIDQRTALTTITLLRD